MQIQSVFLVVWMSAVLFSGAHWQPPPMPGLFQSRWPLLGPTRYDDDFRQQRERRWHHPALAHAAATLEH
jgi:hypothetical protein